jgi:hypothetical protein
LNGSAGLTTRVRKPIDAAVTDPTVSIDNDYYLSGGVAKILQAEVEGVTLAPSIWVMPLHDFGPGCLCDSRSIIRAIVGNYDYPVTGRNL